MNLKISKYQQVKNIIIGPAFPLRGGIANFNLALCRAFLKQGIDSSIYSFSLQYPGFLFPGTSQFEEGEAPSDLRIVTCINSINPFNWIRTAYRIYKEKPDCVIIAYWMPFMSPALGTIARILKKHNIKIIAITHNVIPHEHHFYDKSLTKYFVNSCDGFVTLAKSVLDDLSGFTKTENKIFIPHPIYDIFGEKISKTDARKYLGLLEQDKILLFFGLIRRYKGLDLLLKAMAKEEIKKLNLKLLVAGEFYEDKTVYEKLIQENNLSAIVIVSDKFIPGEDVKYYFCASDMVVQPYHTATQSGVTQIAYHFERPMLVTNVGGLAEIVPHKKVGYVTDVTPESIAEALLDFYENKQEDYFSKNVAVEKAKFSWHSMVEGILKMLK